ncbi:hypothetical protein H6F73_20815 [Microcoleus sp. FACHB-68]|nr:hypothetical protein [Microcoleus sp. FACHB-68]
MREVYITEEKEDLSWPIFGFIPEMFPSASRRRKGQQEVNMKTVKHSEDIDSLLNENHLSSRKSKTTELGEQFIEYIENPFTRVEPL